MDEVLGAMIGESHVNARVSVGATLASKSFLDLDIENNGKLNIS